MFKKIGIIIILFILLICFNSCAKNKSADSVTAPPTQIIEQTKTQTTQIKISTETTSEKISEPFMSFEDIENFKSLKSEVKVGSFMELLNAFTDKTDKIILTNDITIPFPLSPDFGDYRDAEIDLNGHTLEFAEQTYLYIRRVKLSIFSSLDGAKIIFHHSPSENADAYIVADSSLTLKNLDISILDNQEEKYFGNQSLIENSSHMTIDSVNVNGEISNHRNLKILNSKIEVSESDAIGIINYGGTLEIKNSEINVSGENCIGIKSQFIHARYEGIDFLTIANSSVNADGYKAVGVNFDNHITINNYSGIIATGEESIGLLQNILHHCEEYSENVYHAPLFVSAEISGELSAIAAHDGSEMFFINNKNKKVPVSKDEKRINLYEKENPTCG